MIIVDANMPKNCEECPFISNGLIDNLCEPAIKHYCMAMKEGKFICCNIHGDSELLKIRQSWCPIVGEYQEEQPKENETEDVIQMRKNAVMPASDARTESDRFSDFFQCLDIVQEAIGAAVNRGNYTTKASIPAGYTEVFPMVKGALRDKGYTVSDNYMLYQNPPKIINGMEFDMGRSIIFDVSWEERNPHDAIR